MGILDEISQTKDRDLLSTKQMLEKTKSNLSKKSYVVSSSNAKKSVLVLSTIRPLQGVTKDDNCGKSAMIKLYDCTKGGMDNVNQRMATHSTTT